MNPQEQQLATERMILPRSNTDHQTGAYGLGMTEYPPKMRGAAGAYPYTMKNKIPVGASGRTPFLSKLATMLVC